MSEINVVTRHREYASESFEVIERKGIGHPDTLSDALAETLSSTYSKYTLAHFGAILHHNFDKVGMMGGRVDVTFGHMKFIEPIRVLLNGRASWKFAGTEIPVRQMLVDTTKRFFAERFPMLDPERDLRIIYEVSGASSPGEVDTSRSEGKRKYWFEPRSLDDLGERKRLACNDTSLGVGYFGRTPLETVVHGLETRLNSAEYKADKPWLGSDIKLMAVRRGDVVDLTMCVPQISRHVADLAAYKRNVTFIREEILAFIAGVAPQFRVNLSVNTRDKYDTVELYLTATGSSIETGDEGFVGRGNRMGGLITPGRVYTMEGICGKNPVYHVGKMYCVAAYDICRAIHGATGIPAQAQLIGQSGQLLRAPWLTLIQLDRACDDAALVSRLAREVLDDIAASTRRIIDHEYPLY